MKKFAFTLERLRGYQERILDEEKNKLGQLRQKQHHIEMHIRSLEEAFDDLAAQLARDEREGVEAYKLKKYDLQLTSIRHQLEQLHVELKAATAAVDVQMDVVVKASQEVSKLDKLEEKQRETYDTEVRKAEAQEIDEFVSSDTIRKKLAFAE